MTISQLERERRTLLESMQALRAMRPGTVVSQYLKVSHRGQAEPALRGPYWVYTRKVQGRTLSQRLSAAEAEPLRRETEAYHRFQELCRRYAEVTERLGELERAEAQDEAVKKKSRKSPSRKTRK